MGVQLKDFTNVFILFFDGGYHLYFVDGNEVYTFKDSQGQLKPLIAEPFYLN